jgi:histone H3/H4
MLFLLINMSRPNIGKSTVHRLLGYASGGARVSDAAADAAVDAVVEYLEKAGARAKKHLDIAKRKTVTKAVAEEVLVSACAGITAASLGHRKGEKRGLPVAGVIRTFSHEGKGGKKSSGLGLNISEEAKKMIAGAAESFVEQLGKRARMISEKMDKDRSTVKARDIEVALMGMSL